MGDQNNDFANLTLTLILTRNFVAQYSDFFFAQLTVAELVCFQLTVFIIAFPCWFTYDNNNNNNTNNNNKGATLQCCLVT